MIFVTVGSQFPFDRLIKAIDECVSDIFPHEEVFAQIGKSDYIPENIQSCITLSPEEYRDKVAKARLLIGHAGMGTITMALDYCKPLLVLPRSPEYGEVVNKHQFHIAKEFAAKNHVLAAMHEDEISSKLKKLPDFVPSPRVNTANQISLNISNYLEKISSKSQKASQ